MKNTVLKLALVAALFTGITSCDLDQYPSSSIPQDQAIKTINDVQNLRMGAYAVTKRVYGRLGTLPSDIQTDLVCATRGYSNALGYFYNWQLQPNDYDVTDTWEVINNSIANINFLLDGIGNVTPASDDEAEFLETTKGELYLMRAMCVHKMALLYCEDYDPADAENQLGTFCEKHYNAEANPSRESLYDSYQFILEDIELAEELITAAGEQNASIMNVDCITALKAKVALSMKEYGTAITAAMALVNNATYGLENNATEFAKIWSEDTGKEMIFTFTNNTSEAASAASNTFGTPFVSDPQNNGVFQPDFIPSAYAISLFGTTDIRNGVYIKKTKAKIAATEYTDVWIMSKYPGNVSLRSNATIPNYRQLVKVHRIADFYLIAAEAYAMRNQAGDIAAGSDLINDLRSNRITDWTAAAYTTQSALMTEVKLERAREMFMEGTRLADLKRWGQGMTRQGPQNPLYDLSDESSSMVVPANDYMWLWPIPTDEVEANPNVKPQQNEGYIAQ